MKVKKYQELMVWQKAMDLAKTVYKLTSGFPADERFGLTTQLRRAVVSIPSNIAEGQGRNTSGEFAQFLGHARGSLYEVETQLHLSCELDYIPSDQRDQVFDLTTEVAKLLNGLIRSINAKRTGQSTNHNSQATAH